MRLSSIVLHSLSHRRGGLKWSGSNPVLISNRGVCQEFRRRRGNRGVRLRRPGGGEGLEERDIAFRSLQMNPSRVCAVMNSRCSRIRAWYHPGDAVFQGAAQQAEARITDVVEVERPADDRGLESPDSSERTLHSEEATPSCPPRSGRRSFRCCRNFCPSGSTSRCKISRKASRMMGVKSGISYTWIAVATGFRHRLQKVGRPALGERSSLTIPNLVFPWFGPSQ